jgi:hypothetical protein
MLPSVLRPQNTHCPSSAKSHMAHSLILTFENILSIRFDEQHEFCFSPIVWGCGFRKGRICRAPLTQAWQATTARNLPNSARSADCESIDCNYPKHLQSHDNDQLYRGTAKMLPGAGLLAGRSRPACPEVELKPKQEAQSRTARLIGGNVGRRRMLQTLSFLRCNSQRPALHRVR